MVTVGAATAAMLFGVARMIGDVRRDLTTRVDAIAAAVRDVDRRLARLEGWLAHDRAGRDPAPAS